jgi:hypothetical protein
MVDWTIVGANGKTQSHKLYLIGGNEPTCTGSLLDPDGNSCLPVSPFNGNSRLIEVIELSNGNGGPAVSPTWSFYGKLVQNTGASHALAMPDGNIFVCCGGGAGNAANVVSAAECATTIGGPCGPPTTGYEGAVNLRNQMICINAAPYCSYGAGSVQVVGKMTVPRAGIHAVNHLLPTGEPLISAYDRTAIARANSRQYTPGDADLALNSSQIFTPPYLYDSSVPCPTSVGCKLAKRPVIHKGPDKIGYGKKFNLQVDNAGAIKMVSMIRTGSATHSLAQDQVGVRVPFKVIKNKGKGDDDDDGNGKGKGHAYGNNMIEVLSPTKPVQAKPGDYMLFIVNAKGTPSIGKHVRLGDSKYVQVPKPWAKKDKGHGDDDDDD